MLYGIKNPHGGDIYGQDREVLDFSANTNPYGTPPSVIRAMEAALARVHRYPDPYCRKLVEAIADFEGVSKEHILCGNGAAELIYAYAEAVKPKRAMELAPTFSEYSLALERVGCTVERYALKRNRDYRVDQELIHRLATASPDVVFLCDPNNPTGQRMEPGLMTEVLELCRRKKIRVFVDECFADLAETGAETERCVPALKDRLDRYPGLFLLKAFTKSYGMAGVRLGYGMTADKELLTAMSKSVQPWNVSSIAQAAGIAALGEQGFLENTRALIREERRWLTQHLEALGLWVCPSSANYLLFQAEETLGEELSAMGILIRDCSNYHGLEPGWYRIAVKTREENERLIGAVERLCGKGC